MERVILHCDANAFYASVECLYTPSIRHRPVAVCGSVEERHGIVLTKNQIAKQFGVQTGEAIWQARQKCPDLICVPPDYGLYIRFSKRMRRIYEEYSDRVESFGLDEAWIDLSSPGLTVRGGERIAHEIRLRVKRELGITVSVGVSFNKIFAKLGSDMKKPDAVTVIPVDSFREKVWPLPVGDLLFVGPATRRKLADMNVRTIGDLARFDAECLRGRLGKPGLVLKAYAAGLDRSPVMPADARMAIQSVGNSATPPHDLQTPADVRCLCYLLAESVAARLRQEGLRARCVSLIRALGAQRRDVAQHCGIGRIQPRAAVGIVPQTVVLPHQRRLRQSLCVGAVAEAADTRHRVPVAGQQLLQAVQRASLLHDDVLRHRHLRAVGNAAVLALHRQHHVLRRQGAHDVVRAPPQACT